MLEELVVEVEATMTRMDQLEADRGMKLNHNFRIWMSDIKSPLAN